ncbi:MAG: BCCT family transporter [Gammaproteobacteria bacterium]|tara:strand:+ start:943 stop:2424 length:1482 start_codon:yes stop_codon:yes gene_type:complete
MLKNINPNWNKSVISITILLSLVLSIFVLISPEYSSQVLKNIYNYLSNMFDGFFMYGSFALLIFLLVLALSKFGSFKVKLSNKPSYSMFSWSSMLFAGGIGATLLYWSTVEWIEYYNILKNDSTLSKKDLMLYSRTYPLFHWGFSAWAIYCLPAVAFGIALTLKPDTNLTFSGILGAKNSFNKFILDVLFIGAIICGAGVGLGLSFPLISSVISKIFLIERTVTLDIFTIVICSFIFGMSAYVGVQKGIRRLSNINVVMVIIFLLIILFLGPSKYILSNSADSFVFLLKEYIPMSMTTGTEISINWSVFYWAWWLALAPMIGTFIINVSNNKSLRQIIFGTIFIGSFGCIFSMMILSNLSISLFESGYINSPNIIENNLMSKEELVVKTISSLNYNYLLIAFSIILIIFLCTTYDSATYVLASASMKNSSMESSKSLRVLFAILLVVQPTLLMYLNGVDSFKWIMVIFSIPLLFIYLMLIYSILKNVYSIKIT